MNRRDFGRQFLGAIAAVWARPVVTLDELCRPTHPITPSPLSARLWSDEIYRQVQQKQFFTTQMLGCHTKRDGSIGLDPGGGRIEWEEH